MSDPVDERQQDEEVAYEYFPHGQVVTALLVWFIVYQIFIGLVALFWFIALPPIGYMGIYSLVSLAWYLFAAWRELRFDRAAFVVMVLAGLICLYGALTGIYPGLAGPSPFIGVLIAAGLSIPFLIGRVYYGPIEWRRETIQQMPAEASDDPPAPEADRDLPAETFAAVEPTTPAAIRSRRSRKVILD